MSILFAYLFCITFFAACMVFSGWREEANRHCFTVQKVQSKKEASEYEGLYCVKILIDKNKAPPLIFTII